MSLFTVNLLPAKILSNKKSRTTPEGVSGPFCGAKRYSLPIYNIIKK
jgi:hypothetical protein